MEEVGGLTAIRDLQTEPAPAPTRRRGFRRRFWLILGGVVLVVLLLGGVGANLALANAYGPEAVLTAYLKAQVQGDVGTMWRNASLERPDGGYSAFFDKDAFAAMMRHQDSRPFASFSIQQIKSLDGNRAAATVRLTSPARSTTQTFALATDSSARHFLVYPSWKVVVPATVLHLSLPNQAGTIRIDTIAIPDSVKNSIAVIGGVHHVYMAESPLLQAAEADVTTTSDSDGSVTFDGKLKPEVASAAVDAVNRVFNSCDATKYRRCLGHTYTAPRDGNQYFLTIDDGSNVFYTHYTEALVGDPTATMKETIEAANGTLSVSGSCTSRLTTDTRTVDRSGTFDGRLVWNGSGFSSHIYYSC
jgi:hypothetical protein